MTSLILAAGQQARWEKENPIRFKQLLPVCGEPVLHRIVRQVNNRDSEPPFIITHRKELWMPAHKSAIMFEPLRRRWTVETFWWTQQLWKGRVRILLGDTAYSRTVMDRIFACQDPIRVFGNEYEMYAVSFGSDLASSWRVTFALVHARIHAEKGGKGTLRMFYESLCGFEMGSGKMEDVILDRVCYIQDYTKDFDTWIDYVTFLNKWERKGLVDELQE